jgi:hypothetical protein
MRSRSIFMQLQFELFNQKFTPVLAPCVPPVHFIFYDDINKSKGRIMAFRSHFFLEKNVACCKVKFYSYQLTGP